MHGYVGHEGWEKATGSDDTDIESGRVVNSEGVTGAGGLNGTGQTQYYQPQHEAIGVAGTGQSQYYQPQHAPVGNRV